MKQTIGDGWEGLRIKLQLGGLAPGQVGMMERAYYAGAYAAVTNLAQCLDGMGDAALTALLADYTFEVVEFKHKLDSAVVQATEDPEGLAAGQRAAKLRFAARQGAGSKQWARSGEQGGGRGSKE